MAKSSSISCNGVLYNSILELANAFGIHPSTVARRVRDGWSPEQAVGVSTKPKRVGHGTAVEFDGKQYPNLEALALDLGIEGATLRARLARGYSLDAAAKGNLKPRISAAAEIVEFEGTRYPSKEALASAHGLAWSTVSKRMTRGWSYRQALGLEPEPPRFRNHDGHARDIKWKNTRTSLTGIEPIPDAEGYKIYLITNVHNNKEYIGLTIGKLEDRLKQHFAAARKGRKAPLPNAIRKYGETAFTIQLLRCDATSYEQLQEQEINEIAQRDTIKFGYNSAIGGAVGLTKPITINGRKFPSRSQAAEFFNIDVGVFNLRVTRLKWTPEEAAGLIERSWSGKEVGVTVQGKQYPSIRQAALAYGLDFRKVYDRFSEKGWSIEQALELESPPNTVKYLGMQINVFGVTYSSIAKAAQANGVNSESLRRRVARGESPEDAVNATKSRSRKT